jgi:hypothetical protein
MSNRGSVMGAPEAVCCPSVSAGPLGAEEGAGRGLRHPAAHLAAARPERSGGRAGGSCPRLPRKAAPSRRWRCRWRCPLRRCEPPRTSAPGPDRRPRSGPRPGTSTSDGARYRPIALCEPARLFRLHYGRVHAIGKFVGEPHRDLLKARRLEPGDVLALRKGTGDAADVGTSFRPLSGGEAVLGHDVAHAQPAAWP